MQPNEIVVVLLGKGASVVPYLSEDESRVSVGLGRNKIARIPRERIALATGIVMASQDDLEGFRAECEALATSIDVSDVWEVVAEEADSFRLEELADLHWGGTASQAQLAALALYLDRNSDLFVRGHESYSPRTAGEVEEIQDRRRRQAQREEDVASLIRAVAQGALPDEMTSAQKGLVRDLKGYAIHGEAFERSGSSLLTSRSSSTGLRSGGRSRMTRWPKPAPSSLDGTSTTTCAMT